MDKIKYYRQTPNYVLLERLGRYKVLIGKYLHFFDKKNNVVHKGKLLLIVVYFVSVERFVT
jgi:hypothetical protein